MLPLSRTGFLLMICVYLQRIILHSILALSYNIDDIHVANFNAALVQELNGEQGNKEPSTSYEQDVKAMYAFDATHPKALSLMGSLAYIKGQFQEAYSFYRQACKHSQYREETAVIMYTRLAAGAQEKIAVANEALLLHSSEGNFYWDHWLDTVKQTLINSPPDDDFQEGYRACLWAVEHFPTKRATWLAFVHAYRLSMTWREAETITEDNNHEIKYDYHLAKIVSSSISSSVEAFFDDRYALLRRGLLMFPRDPGLLFCLAQEFVRRGELECAGQAFVAVDYVSRSVNEDPALQSLARELSMETNTLFSQWLGSYDAENCFPFFHNFPFALQRFAVDTGGAHEAKRVNSSSHNLKLNIGCSDPIMCVKEGWTIVDAHHTACVHVLVDSTSDMRYAVANNSVVELYSSHTLEHLSYRYPSSNNMGVNENGHPTSSSLSEVEACLWEWSRVLKPGGRLRVSVPDLQIISELFSDKETTAAEKLHLLHVMYGGQVNQHDFHKTGFLYSHLYSLLENASFCDIRRVESFDTEPVFINDGAHYSMMGRPISINIEAWKCNM